MFHVNTNTICVGRLELHILSHKRGAAVAGERNRKRAWGMGGRLELRLGEACNMKCCKSIIHFIRELHCKARKEKAFFPSSIQLCFFQHLVPKNNLLFQQTLSILSRRKFLFLYFHGSFRKKFNFLCV